MKKQISQKSTREKIATKRPRIDLKLLILITILLSLGTLMVISASMPYAESHYQNKYYYVTRQVIFLLIGTAVLFATSRIPVRIFKRFSLHIYLLCLALLILVLLGGFSEGVAKRWLGIPGTPLSFQPSELMKLGLILALSWWIDRTAQKKKTMANEIIVPGLFLFGAAALILLEKHLSGTVILVLIGFSIMFIAGASIKKMIAVYGATGICGGIVFLFTNDYAMKRIESFLNPNADILSDKWQTTQGLYAIGSGGVWGRGIGNSLQKYSYVSEPQNDFIFTIFCEETGYFGAVLLISLFVMLIFRGYKIALNAENTYSSLVAFGITSQVGIQALLNMAVVTDLIPNTGISLPFFSYGGSSLVILLAEMGILLSISRKARVK